MGKLGLIRPSLLGSWMSFKLNEQEKTFVSSSLPKESLPFTIEQSETEFKLLKIKKVSVGSKGVPFVCTHDGRTIRYPHPEIKENDTVKFNLKTNKIEEVLKLGVGNLVMIVGGRNLGRIGTLKTVEKHDGSHTIVHIEDLAKNTFATRLENAFVLGVGKKALVSLPRGGGIKQSPLQQLAAKQAREAAKQQKA